MRAPSCKTTCGTGATSGSDRRCTPGCGWSSCGEEVGREDASYLKGPARRIGRRRREASERIAGEALYGPVGQWDGADGLVEGDGEGVPVEDGPFEPAAVPFDGEA